MNDYSLIFLTGSVVLTLIGSHSISRKTTDGALALGLFILAASLYSFGCAMELTVNSLAQKEFWLGVEYLAIPQLPTLALIFAIQYAGKKKWATRKFISSVIGFSLLISVMEWTNNFHHWYYSSVALDATGLFPVIATTKGFLYWAFMIYTNAAAFSTNALLLNASRRGKREYRKQALIFSVGSMAPWAFLLVYLAGMSPGGLDITPLGFVLTGIIYVWGTFRYRMFDLVPIALENIWENMKDGMILIDDTGLLLNFNASARKILSWFAAPSQGMNIATDFHEFSDYMRDWDAIEDEGHFLTVGETPKKYFNVSISPILDGKNHELGRAVILTDITERKEMEEDISESERNYRELVENALVGVYKVKLDGAIIYANKAMADMLGYDSPQELMAVNSSATYKIDNERDNLITEVLNFGRTRKSMEFELVTKKGEVRNVLLSASLDKDVISGMAKDITEIRTLESQFIQAQKLEGLGNIAAGIAHDFNNLLGVILGYSEWLGKSGYDKARIERGMKAIVQSAERGKSLVRQLMTFARKTNTTFVPVQVNEVVRELERVMVETFPKTIEIFTRLMDRLPYVSGDQTQINQVLLNMCLNARDAMEKGGRLRISTNTTPGKLLAGRFPDVTSREFVEIQITDTGTGMDENTRQRIFEPFFTTKGIGKGTGLGLSVAYGIVESHRGYIEVESRVGEGTTFSVYLPVMEEPSEQLSFGIGSPSEIRGGKETVLIAEDEEMLRELVTYILSSNGYRTLTAADGYEALDVFKKNDRLISLVISDLGLPKISGEDLVAGIKHLRPEAKVIVASGLIEMETRSRLERNGVRHFINKPYRIDEVLSKVREVLDSPDGT